MLIDDPTIKGFIPMHPRLAAAFPVLLATTITLCAAERITFGDWVLECATKDQASAGCQLRQTLADAGGRRILQLTVKRTGGVAFLEAIAPLSISIPFGVALVTGTPRTEGTGQAQSWSTEVTAAETARPPSAKSKAGGDKASMPDKNGGKPAAAADDSVALELASCDPDGCRAVTALDEALLGKLADAPRLAIRFQDSKSGKVLTIEASPKGLAEGAPMVLAAP